MGKQRRKRKVVKVEQPAFPAARRAFARHENLLPPASDIDSFKAWLARIGEDIEDEDELLTFYEASLALAGRKPPASLPVVEASLAPPPTDKLHAPLAAQAFVDWLYANKLWGVYRNDELEALYQRHCAEEGLSPLVPHFIRPYILKQPGVDKAVDVVKVARGKYAKFRVWIFPEPDSVENEIPFDLPERKVTEKKAA